MLTTAKMIFLQFFTDNTYWINCNCTFDPAVLLHSPRRNMFLTFTEQVFIQTGNCFYSRGICLFYKKKHLLCFGGYELDKEEQ